MIPRAKRFVCEEMCDKHFVAILSFPENFYFLLPLTVTFLPALDFIRINELMRDRAITITRLF